jgi:hypothetical protein
MIDDLGLVPTFRAKHNSNFRPGLALKWNLNFTLVEFQGKIYWGHVPTSMFHVSCSMSHVPVSQHPLHVMLPSKKVSTYRVTQTL